MNLAKIPNQPNFDITPYMVQLMPGEGLLEARARWKRETGLSGPILIY